MWPWEHVVVAYLLFSLGCRAARTAPRSGPAVGLLVLGALLPDLVDKPLAWQWQVFDTGYGVAHSIFLAVPVSIAALLIAARLSIPVVGVAFATGYLSHLAGDLASWYIRYGEVRLQRVVWPLGDQPRSPAHRSVIDGFRFYLERSLTDVQAGDPDVYLVTQSVLLLLAAGLWILDGMPGIR